MNRMARIVDRIFREFANGDSPRNIAKRLNREGVPGPDGRPWGDTTIRGQADRATAASPGLANRGSASVTRTSRKQRCMTQPLPKTIDSV